MRRALFVLLASLGARVASGEPHVVARGDKAHKPHARMRVPDSPDDKARAALAVIDGTASVAKGPTEPAGGKLSTQGAQVASDPGSARGDGSRIDEDRRDARAIARSLKPWRATILERGDGSWRSGGDDDAGDLRDAERLEPGDGYYLRRPSRAWGEPYVVAYVQQAIAEVRALYPDVPTLAIGDLSAEHGGELPGHVSHRTGRDVDIGFYFHHAARGFEDAGSDLDLEATWALLAAFAQTSDRPDGVQMIFLDYAVQKRLYDFAKARGTPADELAFLFQYPAGKDALTGLVRHWPNHANHLHVRFKSAASR